MKDEGGRMKNQFQKRRVDSADLSARRFILHPSSFILAFALLACIVDFSSIAQTSRRSGAHSTTPRQSFTPADRLLVERAIGAACAERMRDPLGSTPIDEMQSRPSLPVTDADAVSGARRAERLLPTTRKLVAEVIVQLSKEYQLFETVTDRNRMNAATAR